VDVRDGRKRKEGRRKRKEGRRFFDLLPLRSAGVAVPDLRLRDSSAKSKAG